MHTTKVLSIAHSTVFHRSISTMFSSNKILQRNSNISYRPYTIHTVHTIQTQHCSWTPQFLHTAKTAISAMLSIASTLYIAATHNITHSQCTSTCTPSTTHHTAFHNLLHITNKHTKHICVTSGKMTQDVGMMWKCCDVIPIWFRVPSLHTLVFIQKTIL